MGFMLTWWERKESQTEQQQMLQKKNISKF